MPQKHYENVKTMRIVSLVFTENDGRTWTLRSFMGTSLAATVRLLTWICPGNLLNNQTDHRPEQRLETCNKIPVRPISRYRYYLYPPQRLIQYHVNHIASKVIFSNPLCQRYLQCYNRRNNTRPCHHFLFMSKYYLLFEMSSGTDFSWKKILHNNIQLSSVTDIWGDLGW